MRPLKLELQAFGPFVQKQTVDFEKLSQSGIFLIKGATGSGKTTIFDAMMIALYGGCSGEGDKAKSGRNDLEAWRCTQAENSLDTYVSFTFAVQDRKYIFTRKLTMRRVRLASVYEAGEIDANGNVHPFFANPTKEVLNQKAEELIGLTKDQFRQVVLLPQGQFERFLTAQSSEKEAILGKIFGSERWGQYVDAFFRKATECREGLRSKKNEIDSALREEGLETVEGLTERIENRKNEIKDEEDEHARFNGEARQKALNEERTLAERFRPFHKQEADYKALCEKKEENERKQRRYEEAEKAEKLRVQIDEYESAQQVLSDRQKAYRDLTAALPAAEQSEKEAGKNNEEHKKNSPVDHLTRQIGIYESKKPAYKTVETLTTEFSEAEKNWKKADRESKQAEKSLAEKSVAAVNAKKTFDRADELAKEYRDRYFAGIYGEIASELAVGRKCPVCGSTTHPEPARKSPGSVTKVDVDRQEKEASDAKDRWNQAEEEREKTGKEKEQKDREFSAATTSKETAEAKLQQAKEELIEDIPDSAALENAIAGFRKEQEDYTREAEKLEDAYRKAEDLLTSLRTRIKTAETEEKNADETFRKKKEELDTAMSQNGYTDIRDVKKELMENGSRSKLHEEIVGYITSCKESEKKLGEIREQLKGQTEPDTSTFEERQKKITEENRDYSGKKAALEAEINRLTKKVVRLSALQKDYDENIHEAETDLQFAKKLRGDASTGLQRYVLAIMFNQVVGEANRMLKKVHGGRYQLFRTDERANGNARGLELKVHDNRSPERDGRGVAMMSGGEKFLASLALSIGLSATAQKSGIRIEALFIDEGFGTLDDSSIHDALEVLKAVQIGKGTIGIISHVPLLEANIPTHLEVIKDDKGNYISPV